MSETLQQRTPTWWSVLTTTPAAVVLIALSLAIGFQVTSHSRTKDASALYYGARCLFHGHNPYNNDALLAEWASDGERRGPRPGTPNFMYLYPPTQALFQAPAAALPFAAGRYVINLINLLAFALTGALLCALPSVPWDRRTRTLFWLLLPWGACFSVVMLGQSAPNTCLAVAAGLYAFRRRSPWWAAAMFGLSLSKFTLSAVFLTVLLYRRHWAVATAAIGAFAAVCLLFLLPIGPKQAVADYRALVQYSMLPEHINDAGGQTAFDFTRLVDARRLFHMVSGGNRALADRVDAGFVAVSLLGLAYALRLRGRRRRAFDHPLEIGIAGAAALTLFYHAHVDLVALAFPLYAILEYRTRWPERQPGACRAALALTMAAAYQQTVFSRSAMLRHLIERTTGLTSIGPPIVLALFLVMLWMVHADTARYADAGDAAEPAATPAPA